MRLLLAMTIAGAVAMSSGCAAEDKNPRTVTEFLKMPRVGEVQP